VKDRAALRMIEDALRDGRLQPGMTLIDSTSGNTGIAYAWIGAALQVPVTLVMPLNVSHARKRITRALGAELVFSDPLEQSDGAIRLVRKLVAERPEAFFYPDQYSNPSNPQAHFDGTGLEIWEQTDHRVTHFIGGLGTSGTLMGTSSRLKRENPRIQVVAVEPDQPLHGLEGLKHLGSSIVPAIYERSRLDATIAMPTEEAWAVCDRLAKEEGLFVGHSAGAAVAGALRVARGLVDKGEAGVLSTLLCDRADRYFEPLRWDE
jgi:cysteine synthase B